MMKNNNYNNWDDKCNTWSTDESEEEKPILLIYKVTSTSTAQQASTEPKSYYRVHMSKDVEGLSIKRLNTAKKIKMYMRKAEDRCLVKLEEPLDETSSSSSSSTHETETSTGLQNTIPNGSSLTTHGSRNSNYDNQEYWKGILQTNGGLDLLAQASQDYFGNNTQITTTSNSTNGGMDIMTKRPLLLRNGVPKTSAPGPNLKSGPIGTHSALRSRWHVA